MKKTIAFMLTLVMSVCLLSVCAHADGTVYTEGYFYYTIADESITITGYFGHETEVTVPAQIAGIPVNTIAEGAFAGTSVQILHLPDTVRTVEELAAGSATVVNSDEQPTITPTPTPQPTPAQTQEQTQGSAPAGADEDTGITTTETNVSSSVNEVMANAPEVGEEDLVSPEPSESPGPSEEPTEAPEASAEPEATPEAETPAAKSGGALGWIIGAAVLVCGGAAVVLLRKKGGKA